MAISEVPSMFSPPNEENRPAQESPNIEQEAQEDLVRIFPAMVCGDVQSMRQAFVQAKGLYEPTRAQFIQSRLLPTAHRLKTQGSVFGYPLVSDVAAHLISFIQSHDSFEGKDLDFIQNDLLMLQNILWKKLKGDGGEYGRKILNQLI